jgi:hypothetical protein
MKDVKELLIEAQTQARPGPRRLRLLVFPLPPF